MSPGGFALFLPDDTQFHENSNTFGDAVWRFDRVWEEIIGYCAFSLLLCISWAATTLDTDSVRMLSKSRPTSM